MSHIVAVKPEGFDPSKFQLALYSGENGGIVQFLEMKVSDIRFKKSQEELDERKRKYRVEYNKRQEVREKNRIKNQNPVIKETRKNYASQPRVKERKKSLSKRSRAIPGILKKKAPELYHQIVKEVDNVLQEHVKPLFHCGTHTPFNVEAADQEFLEETDSL